MHIFAPMYSHAYTHILYVKKTVKNRTARREGIRKHKILYLCALPDRSLLWIFTFTYLLYTHAHWYSHKFFHTFTCTDKHINIYTHTSMNVSLNIPVHIYLLDMYIEEGRERESGRKRERAREEKRNRLERGIKEEETRSMWGREGGRGIIGERKIESGERGERMR